MNDAIYRVVSECDSKVLEALGKDFLVDMFSKDPYEDFKTSDKEVAGILCSIMQVHTNYSSVDVVETGRGEYMIAFMK